MPRPPRLHVPEAIYHVTLRGNHRRRIFHKDADYRLLEDLVAEIVGDHDLTLHAYCWMPNHIHMALQVSDQPLARPMQRLASRYARRIQARLETTGHFFERRYHAVIVDSERYLMALVRYIHLNPVRAAIVARPEDHPWSSHRAYLTGGGPEWLTITAVMQRLGDDAAGARSAYLALMQDEPTSAELEYLRRRPVREIEDNNILGAVKPYMVPNLPAIEELIFEECQKLGVAPHTLQSPAHGRLQALARARIAWRALRSGTVVSLTELVPHLGRSASTLHEGLRAARRRRPELFRG